MRIGLHVCRGNWRRNEEVLLSGDYTPLLPAFAQMQVQPVEWIVERVEQALAFYPPQAIFLNPDCGFGCFANRCVNDEQTATAKLRQMVKSAQLLREKYG